jgi:hypothetical protein
MNIPIAISDLHGVASVLLVHREVLAASRDLWMAR